MSNKKIALIVTAFIVVVLLIAGMMGIAGHIPLLGKPIVFIFSIILAAFVVGFFIIIAKRRKK